MQITSSILNQVPKKPLKKQKIKKKIKIVRYMVAIQFIRFKKFNLQDLKIHF